jgi:enoyl-CoA hydratase/carnithine racemase
LQDFLNAPPAGESSPVFRFLTAISTARKPIVAAVSGSAIGVGTTMLLHCDLVYAGPSARFQLPFVNLGLSPEAAASLLLPRLLGYHRAAERLLLGEAFGAEEAYRDGLVNAVVPDVELLDFARSRALEIAKRPPQAVLATKALLRRSTAALVAETMEAEMAVFLERLASPEAKEAFQAFFERRPADFSKFD